MVSEDIVASCDRGPVTAARFVTIARILRPWGRRGEVAAQILTDFPTRFERLKSVFLEVPGRGPSPLCLERAWLHKGRVVLKFSGIDSIENALPLRGAEILVPWEERVPIPADHYYAGELIGCRVILRREELEIGTVASVEPTGGVDVLHIKRAGGKKEFLLPLAREICTRIDVSARIIVIEPPEDLLDLNG